MTTTTAIAQVEAESRTRHRNSRAWAMVAIGILPSLILLVLALLQLVPHSPTKADTEIISLPPGPVYWFGTDASGFDVFSRVITSARTDIPLAVGGTLASLIIGVPIGLLASSNSWLANGLMRFVDVLQALPLLIVALAIVALAGNNIGNVIFAIMLVNAPGFIRLVRAQALVLRQSRFIEAAHAIGASNLRILWRHLLPNVSNVVLVQTALGISNAIVIIASLNFLGVGVAPPTPSWGSMIAEGAGVIGQGQWWVAFFPSLAILIVIVTVNIAARALDELTKEH
jgi:peptide/nickel transport system permease protein